MSLHYSTLLLTLAASSLTALAQSTAHYAVNVEKNQTITHPNRQLRSVSLQSADGLQTQTVGTRLVYNDLSAKTFTALPGDAVHLSLTIKVGQYLGCTPTFMSISTAMESSTPPNSSVIRTAKAKTLWGKT